MSKYTVSKSRTTQEWAKQLEAKTFTIRERVYYENGIEVKSVKNIELDNNHKIRGYSDPFKQAIHNYQPMYMKIKQAKPLYQEYMELKPEHKKRILLSNLMRFKQNEPIIPVPPFEVEYHKKFKELTDAIQQTKS